MGEFGFIGLLPIDFLDLSTYSSYLNLFGSVISYIFSFDNADNIFWWIFIILALSISSHMELSVADIKGSAKGFLYLAGGLLVADIVLYFVSLDALEGLTTAMASVSISGAVFLAISAVFSVGMLLIALSIKGVMKIINK